MGDFGCYGHSVGRSLALGDIPASLAGATHGFEVEIIGERRKAERQVAPAFDQRLTHAGLSGIRLS